jgi:uncharacterized protein YceK
MKHKLAGGGLAVAVLVAFAIFVGFGCGTIANMGQSRDIGFSNEQIPPRPFGGVARDVQWIVRDPWGFFLFTDIPFSLVGDVLTLPKALPRPYDPLQVAICQGGTSAVLKEIAVDSPIEQARAVLEKHGFECSDGSSDNDEKPEQKKFLRATTWRQAGLLGGKRLNITVYHQDDKVTNVEVEVKDEAW